MQTFRGVTASILVALGLVLVVGQGWAQDLHELRNTVAAQLRQARDKGYAMPKVADPWAYGAETLQEVESRLKTAKNPCLSALETALYLDSRRAETSVGAALEKIENPGIMALEIAAEWVLPDGVGVSTSLLDYLFKVDGHFGPIGTLTDAVDSWKIMKRHFVGTVESESGGWAYAAWREASDKKWTDADLKAQHKARVDLSASLLAEIEVAKEGLDDQMMWVDLSHGQARLDIEKRHADAVDAIRMEAGGNALRLEEPAFVTKLANAKNVFAREWGEELQRYQDAQNKVIADHTGKVARALKDIARLQVEQATLKKYVVHVLRGECEQTDQPLQPSAEEKASPLNPILGLAHDRLKRVLGALRIEPPKAFMNCLCAKAGWGSPQTSRFYHPDTWGPYDKRYVCQRPGEPCIVEGYGCLRFPLPSDPAVWTGCAAEVAGAGERKLTTAIEQSVAARAAKAIATRAAKDAAAGAAK